MLSVTHSFFEFLISLEMSKRDPRDKYSTESPCALSAVQQADNNINFVEIVSVFPLIFSPVAMSDILYAGKVVV